ncbi:hypothetical protein [Hyphomicrobium sp.]|uniref:hypothetical protein n=1 Tax=Hyphomicrobium sp. TaxID=82 RepID=UPI002E35A801|nr:hypothetical protein [Hyphomicrobium sp.]HEX2842649.1 hypothetical protein [Hyphomicrobium sp.]
MHAHPFELLELPDGRWCVAKIATAGAGLVAGSFAALEALSSGEADPVGTYPSRDDAELAVQRAAPSSRDPLSLLADLLR